MKTQVDHRHYKTERVRPPNGKHEYNAKLHALSVYAETLSQSTASEITGIPRTTINAWLEDDESNAFIDNLRQSLRAEVAYKYVNMAILACDNTIDRLVNGDEVVTAKGETVRVKVKARDCAVIAQIATDKHALLTGMSTGSKAGAALEQIAANLIAALNQHNTKLIEHEPESGGSLVEQSLPSGSEWTHPQ